MARTFKGRPLVAGRDSGRALVKKGGMNPIRETSGISGRMVCLPVTVGSTTGGTALQAGFRLGGPAAMLFSRRIDPVAAAGILLAQVWDNREVITIDELGDEFLDYVRDNMTIDVKMDGTVTVR